VRLIFKPQILEKLETRHGVSQAEVEDVMAKRSPQRCTIRHGVKGRTLRRYLSVGKTSGGRFLRVIHDAVLDEEGRESMVIITALNAYEEDEERYKKHGGR